MSMYHVKAINGGDMKIDLPTCMYKMPNIHAGLSTCMHMGSNIHAANSCTPEHVLQQQNGEVDPALKALLVQQDMIMTKLYKLKAAVEIHAENSCTPEHVLQQNGEVDLTVKALLVRRDVIMGKLYKLKAAVEGLAKIVTPPDADLDLTVGSSLDLQSSSSTHLDTLLGKNHGALRDIVINANPSQPPLTLLVLHSLLCQRYRVLSTVHVHSSVSNVPPQLLSCLGPPHADSHARHRFHLGFTLIWKDVPKLQMKYSIQNTCPIEGEANVARFLYKLLAPYPSDPAAATLVDSWVDTAFFRLAEGSAKVRASVLRAFNSALGRNPWLAGPEFSLADVACYCCVLHSGSASAAAANVQRWIKSCENLGHFSPAKILTQW